MLLAVAVCFGAAPLINRVSEQKVEVVKMAADVPQGRIITENDIKIVEVGAHNLSPKAIKDISHVIGMYAAADLKTDSILLTTKITDEANGAEDVFRALDGSQKAISITIDSFAGGLSGKLRNGDIVSIITTRDNQTIIPPELKYVRVITATSSSGNDVIDMDDESEMPKTVTLLVNEAQATILARSEANGKLHIALVYRGDMNIAAKFLEVQEEFFLEWEDNEKQGEETEYEQESE